MSDNYIMVCNRSGVRNEFSRSVGGSVKDCITKYLTNYILVDNFSPDEFEEALVNEYLDKVDVDVEKLV